MLHEGAIAEMRTGEGKTLVATTAVYLNALAGEGVHVVTVNDYLARRDSEWMGQIYKFLGMTVGVIVHGLDDEERRQAYAADVTYGTNNEFGFDYLRDNMKYDMAQMVQRGHAFAIVDEVDSILVDEARTPLIISGPSEDRSGLYAAVDTIIPQLAREDYELDEKQRTVNLTEAGNEHAEELLRAIGVMKEGSLYEAGNATLVHHVNQALRAHKLFQRDKDYIVRNGEVVIVDEFTGRMMPGRRYSEGLHQALEAKEHVTVQPENVTLASITFQNYFRLYKKLAGMTGTAATEADEFAEIYKLIVVEIPTNQPIARLDEDDEVYRTSEEKMRAVVREIEAANAKMQPMLVGTTSIEKSEVLGEVLERQGYKKIDFTQPDALKALYAAARAGKPSKNFAILNARFHEQEAFIVAEAGVPGAITIATNMAGRGTDIQLGGNVEMRVKQEVDPNASPEERAAQEAAIRAEVAEFKQKAIDAGGLYIIGTERHESRRIDNQLRGRSGRQGDPGRSKFFLSLQDDLMRIFGAERMDAMLKRLGLKEDEAIVHPWINKALEKAQQKVEARNFDIRKNILKFDNVMNDQRKVIFEDRRKMMASESLEPTIEDMRTGVIDDLVAKHIPHDAYPEAWDIAGPEAGSRRQAQPRPAGRRLGEGGRHRRRGGRRPPPQGGRGGLRRARSAQHARSHALCREAGDPAIARSPVARASGDARPSASGDRLARHGAARPAQRIQVRGVRALPATDRAMARGGHRPDVARRSALPGAGAPPPPMQFQHLDPATGENEYPVRGGQRARRRRPARRAVRARGRRTRSEEPRHLGTGRPERALPLRIGQEVQALPRAGRLSEAAPSARRRPAPRRSPG